MRSACVAFALVAGCAASEAPPPADDGLPTIVSLNPCADAILAEVAAPGQLRAISHYSHDPSASSMDLAKARAFPATSGAVEEIVALEPDIVVADSFLPVQTRLALERLGLRIEVLGPANSIDEAREQVRALAEATGNAQRGEALIERIDASLASTAADRTTPRASALIWQSGGIVPGRETLIADLLRHTGFASHSAARGMAQAEQIALETVLADPPELILASGSDRTMTHPVLARLDETRSERLDPSLLWCGGPSVIRAAERLAEARDRL